MSDFVLDPEILFLNHGSFGACPRPVLAEQTRLRELMEREPVKFFLRDLEAPWDAARKALATFVGAAPEDLVFVTNASEGVSTVLASLTLGPGDEVLATSHGYNACNNAVKRVCERSRATAVAWARRERCHGLQVRVSLLHDDAHGFFRAIGFEETHRTFDWSLG